MSALFRSNRPTSRLAQRRRRARRIAAAAGGGACAAVFLVLANTGPLIITDIDIRGTNELSAEDVGSAVTAFMRRRPVFFASGRNTLFFDSDGIGRALARQFPRIENVRLSRAGSSALVVRVRERAPDLIWCPQTKESSCYFADSGGVAYARATSSPRQYLAVNDETATGTVSLPHQAIGRRARDAIVTYESILDEMGIELARVHRTAENDLFFVTTEGVEIRSDGKDTMNELQNLSVLLTSHEFKDAGLSVGEEFGRIDYIDLRFGRKLFYRLKQ